MLLRLLMIRVMPLLGLVGASVGVVVFWSVDSIDWLMFEADSFRDVCLGGRVGVVLCGDCVRVVLCGGGGGGGSRGLVRHGSVNMYRAS